MPDQKAFSAPRPRSGQLKVQWGKLYDEDPDLIYAAGDGVPRADRHLMHDALSAPRWMGPLHDKWAFEPSLLEELEARATSADLQGSGNLIDPSRPLLSASALAKPRAEVTRR